jgi:hypothetical protein
MTQNKLQEKKGACSQQDGIYAFLTFDFRLLYCARINGPYSTMLAFQKDRR